MIIAPLALVVLVAWSTVCFAAGWAARGRQADIDNKDAEIAQLDAEINQLRTELVNAEHRALDKDLFDNIIPPRRRTRPDTQTYEKLNQAFEELRRRYASERADKPPPSD